MTYISTWPPLVLVIGISLTKELLEDRKRYRQDTEQNNTLVQAYSPQQAAWLATPWKQLAPGDCVLVRRDAAFPADLLFLSSASDEGTCYVETKNLDGETNLKLKKCVEATKELLQETLGGWPGCELQCDAPNNSLYTFQGTLLTPARPLFAAGHADSCASDLSAQADGVSASRKVSVSPANVLLRGSNLRNTEWVLGCVVYAGHDTKVMMNAMATPSKRSTIELRMDKARRPALPSGPAARSRAAAPHCVSRTPSLSIPPDCAAHALHHAPHVPLRLHHHGAARQG